MFFGFSFQKDIGKLAEKTNATMIGKKTFTIFNQDVNVALMRNDIFHSVSLLSQVNFV